MAKQQQVSDILYSKKKWPNAASVSKQPVNAPTATVSKPQANFDLGMNSQAMPKTEVTAEVKMQPTINVNLAGIDVKEPMVNIDQSPITVTPVINLKASELSQNELGHVQLPPINVQLTININWHLDTKLQLYWTMWTWFQC